MRRLAAYLFIDYRGWTEYTAGAVLLGAFLAGTLRGNFEETLSRDARSTLYGSLAGTSAALLGFVLAALAILVALPSTERLEALRQHPKWPRVPSAYFRAARALLTALVLCTLGVVLDSAAQPWKLYEAVTVAALVFALIRVAASMVALDQIVGLAGNKAPRRPVITDPGP